MVQYLAKRIGRSILTLFVIVTLVFCLLPSTMPISMYCQSVGRSFCPKP